MRSVDELKRGITQAVATVTSAVLKNTWEKFERFENKRVSGGGGHVEKWIVIYFLLSINDLQKDI